MWKLFNYQTVHLEISSKCTLKCPRCPRTELQPDTVNKEVSLEEFKQGFPVDVLSKIHNFIFCGDIGDPIYATEFLEIISYIKQNSGSQVSIVTNGSYKKDDWWSCLGSMLGPLDLVTFSIDGWDQKSNEQYRVNSDFDSIVQGIKSLRAASTCVIQWSTIYFAFNQDRINDIRQLAQSLGCDKFKTVKSSKFGGKYAVNNIDMLKPIDNLVANTLVYEVDVEFLRTNKYRTVVAPTPAVKHKWAKCLNYEKDLFIGVDGLVLPCPWFNNGYQYNSFVEKNQDRLSIKNRSFFDIINDTDLWSELINSFDTDPLEICQLKCKNAQQ